MYILLMLFRDLLTLHLPQDIPSIRKEVTYLSSFKYANLF